jgi:iron complex outermembrane receptor protein
MKPSFGRQATVSLSLSVLLASLSSAAMAAADPADTPDAPDTGVETTRQEVNGVQEVIVRAARYVPVESISANKSDIPLIETPQSVSVISRDQIDLLNFTDAQQAVRYTAGAYGESYGPDLRYDFLTVRGFTPKQYIDGLAAPVSTTIYSTGIDLYAFQSFDVLKGPVSSLYGNAPPGGIYDEISRRASFHPDGELGVKYGTDNYKQVFGTATGALLGDSLAGRFTGMYLDRDAERDYVSAKRGLISPTVTWQIAPRTQLTGLFTYQYDEVNGDTNGFLPVYGTLLPNPVGKVSPHVNLGDPDNLYKRNQYSVGYDFSHGFSDAVTFHSNLKWSEYHERTPTGVYGGGGLINITDPTQDSYYRTVQQYNFTYSEDVSSLAADNRLNIDLATGAVKHKAIVGIDYRRVSNQSAFGFVFGNTIDLFNPVYQPQPNPTPGYPVPFSDENLKQTGYYAQDQLELVKDLYLLLGGRYDTVKINNEAASPATNTDQNKFTYRTGLNYVMPSGFAPYIAFGTSFEPVLGTDSVTGQEFKPSDGRQIEGGVKFDGRSMGEGVKLFATASLFKITQTNVVSTSPSITPVFGTQSGEVQVKGAELEFVARIHDQWNINGSYTYNDSEVTQSQVAAEIGQPLPTTPKNKVSLFGDYTAQRGALAGFGFGFGGRYNSTSAGSLPGPFNPVVYYGQSATLWDAILHYDSPHWHLALNGSNVFGKVYTARCSGPAGCTYGAGRQILGTATWKF